MVSCQHGVGKALDKEGHCLQKRTPAADNVICSVICTCMQPNGLLTQLLLLDCMAMYAYSLVLSYHNPALHSDLSITVSCQSPASRSESFLD